MFFAHSERSTYKFLPQILFSLIFQSCSFQVPDHGWATAHQLVYSYMPAFISFQAKWTSRFTAHSLAHWKDLPSLLSLRDIPVRGCSTAAVHLWEVSAYSAEPSVNQAGVFFSSVSWLYGTPREVIGTGREREDSIAGIGTLDIRTTSSCKSRVPSGLRPNHVYITSICSARLTLW